VAPAWNRFGRILLLHFFISENSSKENSGMFAQTRYSLNKNTPLPVQPSMHEKTSEKYNEVLVPIASDEVK
jgi:hypothetical protein